MQAVLVYLELSDKQFGTEQEQQSIHELAACLEDAIESQDLGEFDGEEFGDGVCTLFMYGADADALFIAIIPILKRSPICQTGYVIKQYGELGDINGREDRVDIACANGAK